MAEESIFDFGKLPDYKWGDLHYFTYELDISLSSIKEAIGHHLAIVKAKRDSLKEAIKKDNYLSSDEKEEVKAQYYHQHFEHAEATIDDLEGILNNSSVLTVFSVLEGKMRYLCESLQNEVPSLIKINDLKANDGIDQYINYLTKIFGVTQSKSVPFLELIKKYKVIRNAIAHHNNTVKINDFTRVKTLPHLKLTLYSDSYSIVITSPQFLYDLIDLVDNYVQEMVKEIDDRWRILKT